MSQYRYQHGDRPLGGYTIQRGVGRGGFGEVYYALSDAGRQVALKAVHNYQDVELRGIGHCMNLKSPHLVTIFDVKYNDAGDPFVVMEYVGGPSLRNLMDEAPGGLGTAKAAFFLREIGKGLSYLHDCGIVHRDLKPQNVFYEDGYVKIGDYSLSKAMSTSHQSGHTVTVGTVHYMAPEIGGGSYDRSIDIYALGVMLYEMLTGQPPYLGSTPGEVLMKHLSADPDLSGIEEPFASVIKRALATDPSDRFQDVQQMVEAIYGAEHVRNSVTSFSPADLTMVAERVAQKAEVEAGAPHGNDGPNDGPTATPGESVGEEISGAVNRFVRRTLVHVGIATGAMRDSGDHQARAASHPAPQIMDSIGRGQRLLWGLITMLIVSFATAIFTPRLSLTWRDADHSRSFAFSGRSIPLSGHDEIIVLLFVFATTLGAVLAIRLTAKHWSPRFRHENRVLARLGIGAAACLAALLAGSWVLAGRRPPVLYYPPILHMGLWVPLLLPLLLLNWRRLCAPKRDDRVSLLAALWAGLCAFVCAVIFRSVPTIAVGVLAGTSLTVQMVSPFQAAPARAQPPKTPRRPQGARHGRVRHSDGSMVPHLGARNEQDNAKDGQGRTSRSVPPSVSTGRRLIALLLCCVPLLGVPVAGLQRFYVGRVGTGILWLVTFGFLGIGQLIDAILIVLGHFKDAQGRPLLIWTDPAEIRSAPRSIAQDGGTVPAPSHTATSSWQPTPASWMLSLTGGMLLAAGVLTGAALALDMPGAVAAGILPGLDREMEQLLGYDQWPPLIHRIGEILMVGLMFLATVLLVVARRGAGVIHMGRVVVAVGVILLGFASLMESFHRQSWESIAMHLNDERIGPAMEALLDGTEMGVLVISAMFHLGAFFVLAWPSRRRLLVAAAHARVAT